MTPDNLILELQEFLFDYYRENKELNTSIIEFISNYHVTIIDLGFILDNGEYGYIEVFECLNPPGEPTYRELDYIMFYFERGNHQEHVTLKEFMTEFIFDKYWKEIKPLIPYIAERMEFELL